MAITFTVNYSQSPSGPWTQFGAVSSTSATVTGLASATTYYFEVIGTDSTLGLQTAAVIIGPITTTGTADPWSSAFSSDFGPLTQ